FPEGPKKKTEIEVFVFHFFQDFPFDKLKVQHVAFGSPPSILIANAAAVRVLHLLYVRCPLDLCLDMLANCCQVFGLTMAMCTEDLDISQFAQIGG
ncbi:hypothetical protein ACJX0J_036325, partial [Zea mays]